MPNTSTKPKVYCYATEARNHLRDLGYREYWTLEQPKGAGGQRVASYWTDGTAHQVILVETCPYGAERCSWDLYGALTTSSSIPETLKALEEFSQQPRR